MILAGVFGQIFGRQSYRLVSFIDRWLSAIDDDDHAIRFRSSWLERDFDTRARVQHDEAVATQRPKLAFVSGGALIHQLPVTDQDAPRKAVGAAPVVARDSFEFVLRRRDHSTLHPFPPGSGFRCKLVGQIEVGDAPGKPARVGVAHVAQTDDGEPLLGKPYELRAEAAPSAAVADRRQALILPDPEPERIGQRVSVIQDAPRVHLPQEFSTADDGIVEVAVPEQQILDARIDLAITTQLEVEKVLDFEPALTVRGVSRGPVLDDTKAIFVNESVLHAERSEHFLLEKLADRHPANAPNDHCEQEIP